MSANLNPVVYVYMPIFNGFKIEYCEVSFTEEQLKAFKIPNTKIYASPTKPAQQTEPLYYANKTIFFNKNFGFIGKLPDYPGFMPGYLVHFNSDTNQFAYKKYVSTITVIAD